MWIRSKRQADCEQRQLICITVIRICLLQRRSSKLLLCTLLPLRCPFATSKSILEGAFVYDPGIPSANRRALAGMINRQCGDNK
uniref:Secreted protein n=1 Tax=Ditylenchus dipsaci TaxID=166011 RepID=A0A915E0B1_9BILA